MYDLNQFKVPPDAITRNCYQWDVKVPMGEDNVSGVVTYHKSTGEWSLTHDEYDDIIEDKSEFYATLYGII